MGDVITYLVLVTVMLILLTAVSEFGCIALDFAKQAWDDFCRWWWGDWWGP